MLTLAALLLLAQPAAAPARPDCLDDDHVDRCDEAQRRRQRGLYDAPAIADQAGRGEQVRRVFYVDGYGSDLAMIAFSRAPGRDIALEVRTPAAEGVRRPPLTADVPLPVWEQLLSASRHFDRKLAPRGATEENICMHSWVYTAEAVDPAANGRPPSVRQAVMNSCQDGLVQPFALALAQAALELLPPCRVIDPGQQRNAVTTLAACTRLSGDRVAAAQAMNALATMNFINRPELDDATRAGFGHRVRFEIDGQVSEQDWEGAAPFWLRQRQALAASFGPESYHGERSDRVLVRGGMWRRGEGGQQAGRAPVELVFEWAPSQMFQITAIKVGGFAPAP